VDYSRAEEDDDDDDLRRCYAAEEEKGWRSRGKEENGGLSI